MISLNFLIVVFVKNKHKMHNKILNLYVKKEPQRLTRFIGKSKAMEMILTGRLMDAEEAERSGLVARVVPTENLLIDVLEMAKKISEFSMPSVMMAKECVNKSYEMTLHEGVRFERRIFHSLFATDDQKEGMAAFIEKRSAAFKHE